MWLYHKFGKFGLSLREVEDLLTERGVGVFHKTIRRWHGKFGSDYARRLRQGQGRLGDTWFLDEVFVTINGERQNLWRAVDQDGDVIDILVQSRRNRPAAERFFHKLLKSQEKIPSPLPNTSFASFDGSPALDFLQTHSPSSDPPIRKVSLSFSVDSV